MTSRSSPLGLLSDRARSAIPRCHVSQPSTRGQPTRGGRAATWSASASIGGQTEGEQYKASDTRDRGGALRVVRAKASAAPHARVEIASRRA